jgi:hypothetical protein
LSGHTALGCIGLVPLATVLGSCLLYSSFGFSTCRVAPHKGA